MSERDEEMNENCFLLFQMILISQDFHSYFNGDFHEGVNSANNTSLRPKSVGYGYEFSERNELKISTLFWRPLCRSSCEM